MKEKTGWLAELATFESQGIPCVLVTVVEEKGSTPRTTGTKMIVTADSLRLTIGSGHLEYKAIEIARQMLKEGIREQRIERFALGESQEPCGREAIELLFEPMGQHTVHVAVFGNGHVARALVPLLASLPCEIRWIDSRVREFPDTLPRGVTKIVTDEPLDEVDAMPGGTYFIVMTHNHPLDLELTERILTRNDFGYYGLIGSKTKWVKFQHHLATKGFTTEQINRVRCPLGIPQIKGKLPAEIAISVAGEVIATYSAQATLQEASPLRLVQPTHNHS
ncbi:xanthine dehydrogenase accessory protein XdhC [Pseudomonas luteola]|uniref:Xanthine dehydrogenase accessory protein XdhC n=1 Tax=Pseudomonas luteola TaxID=47886 RepID=A0ABS0MLI9_PSELU|nr:xanthine dehydrogenase accessory protein XdhC [Pseudomonas luteola]MBH3437604.1 xanthine dehydrogenase accessory protein XdhC [Pseudomonas luteola]